MSLSRLSTGGSTNNYLCTPFDAVNHAEAFLYHITPRQHSKEQNFEPLLKEGEPCSRDRFQSCTCPSSPCTREPPLPFCHKRAEGDGGVKHDPDDDEREHTHCTLFSLSLSCKYTMYVCMYVYMYM